MLEKHHRFSNFLEKYCYLKSVIVKPTNVYLKEKGFVETPSEFYLIILSFI